jgi:hypothetical protein
VYLPYFHFVQALAEYRLGRFDQSLSLLQGDSTHVLGPSPRLLQSMALYRSGQVSDARKALASGVLAYDWRPTRVEVYDGWLYHSLRREAERIVIPRLAEFLKGTYQPQENDERLALMGVCQFQRRTVAMAQLYRDVFASAPDLQEDLTAGYRDQAVCAAAQAGCGQGEDAVVLNEVEKKQWRDQARAWLQADLNARSKRAPQDRQQLKQMLVHAKNDPDLAGVRDSVELKKLPDEEQKQWLALWQEIDSALNSINVKK